MNSNYNMWDIEWEHGFNWDDVYEKYLPVFEQFDKDYNKETNPIPNETLKKTYEEFLNPLHNGHFYAEIENIHTGSRFSISPNINRIKKEIGEEEFGRESSFSPSLEPYSMLPESDIRHCDFYNGGVFLTIPDDSEIVADYINAAITFDIKWIRSYYEVFPRYFDEETTEYLIDFYDNQIIKNLEKANAILESDLTPDEKLEKYLNYYYENIQELENLPENTEVLEYKAPLDGSTYELTGNELFFQSHAGIILSSALINGNIPYLAFNSFNLNVFLNKDAVERYSTTRGTAFFLRRIGKAWRKWFNDIQRLSAEGKLKGVIIDLRSNNGGRIYDIRYITGALTNTKFTIGYERFKEGPERFDYSPEIPWTINLFEEEHVDVKAPIVILMNHYSASMSEATALSAFEFADATIVGTTSHGAVSPLANDPTVYSLTYSSCVGKAGSTSFYQYNSVSTFADIHHNYLDGIGISPEPENYIEMDWDRLRSTGMDNQFERALEIINGK